MMIKINIVNYNNNDFIILCKLLEQEHIHVIKEQRSPNANCLNNLEQFKVVFIAYINDKPIGCLAAKDQVNDIIEVGRLYVVPQYRNNGIASNLLIKVEDYARKLGAKALILDTYNRFESAVKLYKKLGFYEIENYISNSPYSICMEKTIK